MKKIVLISVLALAVMLVVTGVALAVAGAQVQREIISGGASASAGGGISMQATLGQPVVGVISGGDVTLEQGFWHSVVAVVYQVFLPLVLR